MLVAARKIEQYTATLTFSDFAADSKTIDAVVRNLSIIGEATRQHSRVSAGSGSVGPLGGHSWGCDTESFMSTLRWMLRLSGTRSRMTSHH